MLSRGKIIKMAKKVLRPERVETYFVPWVKTPATSTVLLLNNSEARFRAELQGQEIPLEITQYDQNGKVRHVFRESLGDSNQAKELILSGQDGDCGLATVRGSKHWESGIYVALSGADVHSVTHGRFEPFSHFPGYSRVLLQGAMVAGKLIRRTPAALIKHQAIHVRKRFGLNLLMLNQTNLKNAITLSLWQGERRVGKSHAFRLAPLGAQLLDVISRFDLNDREGAYRLDIQGFVPFNYYMLGTGSPGLQGPLFIQHVK